MTSSLVLTDPAAQPYRQATQIWLERAVIGLNLCPFANKVHVNNAIRYCVSAASDTDGLLTLFFDELAYLEKTPITTCETTLLIEPTLLQPFESFLDFVTLAEMAIEHMGLQGQFQLAHFHPAYCFAEEAWDDLSHYTNRSPYPTLHLLREESISRAVTSIPDASQIYERNKTTLRHLGLAGWQALWQRK
ncbi:DUF1415 domain-containing protein [Parvibium lacunae]|uniref:DUF1415 domain-containing protein n=1 Tax=Parvibium lacunae TaxID=1888893 RepID=A0A368L1P8_9BURK|nr:DUF1415 domain-containing protein [Parvibium lacunae]RCS57484.1 DUF1415 domain-containing protein [Parvibium lacunae]